jgi:acetyl esterase
MQVLMPWIDIADVDEARTIERALAAEMRSNGGAGDVDTAELSCLRPDGSELRLRSYRPRATRRSELPMLLFIHGGSFVTGGLHTEDTRCERYAAGAECVVFAVDYRLAPEHRFPAGLDDCVLALGWLRDHGQDLGVDGSRVAVGGLSAGAALAAGTALRCQESDHPPLVLQMLLFPVLDASVSTRSAKQFTDTPVVTSQTIRDMWRLYLGPEWRPGAPDYPRHSSPSHERDLSNSAPTYICTAGNDPLRDEALAYAHRLLEADVSVDLHHYARGFHSFDSFDTTRIGHAALRDQLDALRSAFA